MTLISTIALSVFTTLEVQETLKSDGEYYEHIWNDESNQTSAKCHIWYRRKQSDRTKKLPSHDPTDHRLDLEDPAEYDVGSYKRVRLVPYDLKMDVESNAEAVSSLIANLQRAKPLVA